MSTTETSRTIHYGSNAKRFKEMLGMKQEDSAYELSGMDKKISILEAQERI